jgi:excinuclease UvrABC nuclease subunit
METKQCTNCKKHFPLNLFGKRKLNPDGLHYHCKQCNVIIATKSQKKEKGVYGVFGENGECLYIGSSSQMGGRITSHKSKIKHPELRKHALTQKELYNNITLHTNAFITVLDQCSLEVLKKLEQFYINVYNPLYNKYKASND